MNDNVQTQPAAATAANDPVYAEKTVYRVVINAPIDKVWSELVDTTSPRPFFWNGTWDAPEFAPGNPYRVTTPNGKAVPVIGRILEMDPPNRMVTTFRLTDHTDPPCRVIYTLKEIEGGTEFCLINEQVVAGSKSEKSMAGGSRFIVENFKVYVETGKVTFSARLILGLMSLFAGLTPRVMHIDNWPFDKAE